MKCTQAAAVLLLLVQGSDGQDPEPGLRGVGGPARDLSEIKTATFNPANSPPRDKESGVAVGAFHVTPDSQPFADEGQVTLLVNCQNSRVAASAARGFPEPIKINPSVKVINVPASDANSVYSRLSRRCDVTPDERVEALPYYKSAADQEVRRLAEEEPYGIGMVLEDVAWWESKFDSSPPTGSSKVCVVDTGYGNGHEDLPTLDQNSDGYNPQSSGEWYIDGHSHGTHCAGTIGAIGDNSKGVVGVVPNSINDKFSFFIGKGLSDSGSGSTAGVMAAVQACVDNGSNVISMSLGGGSPSNAVNQQYYGHYKDDDVLIIAAAGNSGNSALSYPASYKSIMSVAAVDSSENKAGFSQYNDQVEIAGPGVSVKSTVTGNSGSTFGYASYSGTSMATPHVAGVAALLRMYFPNCKAFQIRNAMIVTAKDKGDSGCDVNYGHGIVQAKAAYEYLEANACDPNEEFKEPEGGCAEFSCTEDSDCDDGNPDTIDTCNSGSCTSVCATDAACDDGNPNTIDTCTNGVCFHEHECGDFEEVVIELTTDNYPGETEWTVTDENGDEISNGSGYSDANTLHTVLECLSAGQYNFYISDAYGDGICCSYGNGGYVIKHNDLDLISGGEFGHIETETFTIETTTPPPVTPPTPPPVTPPTPPPVTPPTTPPTFQSCDQWNEDQCTSDRGCQWTGDCQNCGCHPCPNFDCADQVMANLEEILGFEENE